MPHNRLTRRPAHDALNRPANGALNQRCIRDSYSGHGTYATLGLMHTDAGARMFFRDNWIKRQAALAGELGAVFVFFSHGVEMCIRDRTCTKR